MFNNISCGRNPKDDPKLEELTFRNSGKSPLKKRIAFMYQVKKTYVLFCDFLLVEHSLSFRNWIEFAVRFTD